MPQYTPTLADKQAKKAAADFTRRGLVFVVARGGPRELVGLGSGTLWRSAAGRPAVLTAHHVVANHGFFTIGSTATAQVRLRDPVVHVHPTDDVALIELPEGELASLAFDVGALSTVTRYAKGAPLVVSGFPEHLSFPDTDQIGDFVGFSDLSYFTTAAGSDAKTISMNWQESDTDEEQAGPFGRVGISPGRHPMKKPSGISGGAAWSWRKPAPDELWAPSTALRVVGVPHKFTNGRQLAVPSWRWRDWLLTRLGLVA